MRRLEKAPQMKAADPKMVKLVDTIISDLGVLSNLVQANPTNRVKGPVVKGVLTTMKKLKGFHWS